MNIRTRFRVVPAILALAGAGQLAACGMTCAAGSCAAPPGSTGAIQVVAAQNFWGSIASQLGGSHVSVTSIVSDPNADPHLYQSSTADARAFANAAYVILNGAGYDDWAQQLLSANQSSSRTVLTVASLIGKRAGDNPHFWYSPTYVSAVVDRITADYKRIDPADASSFDTLHASFVDVLKPEHDLITAINQQFHGRPVAATEDIFVYLSDALGLNLISPREFMQAVAEGNDPPAGAVAAFQQQITSRQAFVLVYNTQTVTAVTTNIQDLARQVGIPVVGISETVQPPDAAFQDWQVGELKALQKALAATQG
jgi:zinc/manganese transport system substrate-binding protein